MCNGPISTHRQGEIARIAFRGSGQKTSVLQKINGIILLILNGINLLKPNGINLLTPNGINLLKLNGINLQIPNASKSEGSFTNDVTQIWIISDPPPPFFLPQSN